MVARIAQIVRPVTMGFKMGMNKGWTVVDPTVPHALVKDHDGGAVLTLHEGRNVIVRDERIADFQHAGRAALLNGHGLYEGDLIAQGKAAVSLALLPEEDVRFCRRI